ncbi:hypothetical protein VOLCADRAFT_102822 [Volvox carteri f. nagariensis]|uniref:Tr-type G domain-containing protein n=1 Tax=Volvox carteri f. nagariensis TaxID=3068 RepID=D8TIC3_VOLCA|nr:uncharacterized protein VOLCADRAFT_102822 [Volvox carteri f. nagariensis]EFJ52866.1 hypothetical protein VOLCADRAFT_102822 [Volvox carteri f. nagariensis]|eukprot:XP_002945871.1 hypothetical protein VOLCADRAFT_102822 [Volvox carteri f. nagariensis]
MSALVETGGKNVRREQNLRPEQVEALRLKREPKDLTVTCIGQEDGEGNVEYKYRIKDPHPVRLQQLITQMKYRLSEGNGECFYYIGIEDNGYPKGLEPADLEASISTLQRMASSLDAFVTLVHYLPAAWGRRAALLRVATSTAQEACHTDLRIAVAGSVDAGKSTLVAVLTHGSNGRPMLDNGRGLARMNVFRHKHEMQSGRTSSICHQLLGYDKDGHVINYATPAATASALSPAEITSCAAKVLTFLDMGGHEKYLKTALYGMTALLPDFGLLCVCGVAGLGRIAREHLAVAVALEVPVAIIITKVELVNAERFAAVVAEVRQLVALIMRHESGMGTVQQQQNPTAADPTADERRVEAASPLVTTESEALASARVLCQLRADSLASSAARGVLRVHMPIFAVSAVSGSGLPVLHTFLNALQPAAPHKGGCSTPLTNASSGGPLLSSTASGASVSIGADSSYDGTSSCGGTSAGDSPRAGAASGNGPVTFNSLDGPAVAAAAAAAAAAAGPQQQLLYAPATAATAAMTPAAAVAAEAQAVHFQVDGTFEVEGVGSVVSGTLVSGMVRLGQELLLGPTATGDFTRVVVRQLQRSHVQVKQVRAGQTCTIAISPAVAPPPAAAVADAATTTASSTAAAACRTLLDSEMLPLGSSPGVGRMAAAAGANGGRRTSETGFEDALAAAQTALDLCLGGDSDGLAADGGADDDLFGFDASDGPTSPPSRRVKVTSPQPFLGSDASEQLFLGSSYAGKSIPLSMSVCQLHSTTSFCVKGGRDGGGAAPGSAAAAAMGGCAAAGLSMAPSSALSTSAPAARTLSMGSAPSPFSGVAPRSKGAVLLEPALQPRTSWTFEAVLILLGGHWPPRGLVSGRWPPAGDEVDAAMGVLQLQLDPRHADTASASASELQRSSSSSDPPTSGQSGSMTPASGGAGDGGDVTAGEKVGVSSSSRRASGGGTGLRIGALSDEGGGIRRVHGVGVPAHETNTGNAAAMAANGVKMRPFAGPGPTGRRGSASGGKTLGLRRRQRSFVTVVHCGSVRQPAYVLMMQQPSDHDMGCLVRVAFRWQHRPEWLREGAKLLVRDRGDGRLEARSSCMGVIGMSRAKQILFMYTGATGSYAIVYLPA